jgi:hypothetical protein
MYQEYENSIVSNSYYKTMSLHWYMYMYLQVVLLRSPDGHPPGRHKAHPHFGKMTIHLTQLRVMRTPHRASPTSRFSRREIRPAGSLAGNLAT